MIYAEYGEQEIFVQAIQTEGIGAQPVETIDHLGEQSRAPVATLSSAAAIGQRVA
jgi:hypothetical protein